MKKKFLILVSHLIAAVAFGWFTLKIDDMFYSVWGGVITACWFICAIIDIAEIIETLEPITLKCPKCNKKFMFRNCWCWIWKSPFHWLHWDKATKRIRDYRKTKCPCCGQKSWIKSIEKISGELQSTGIEEPTYYGKWRLETNEEMPNPMFKLVVCTVCNNKANNTYKFCPHCGELMFDEVTD